ncbi:UDP-N-acetylmuramate:L-alanyl-gamma-D-glutamyl-meso-diaminopimelate ligase [Candidatus Magnetoovum chiemensis]|nr:UDP-N-acetylmuramate:L-alanyl-gamma-D-glutamyl-meso-diaminopimelate ligase [Candidatus Magnetoovum chiemensis]
MDLKFNFIPKDVKKIHLIAACGTGMGALACMLQDMGFEVTGSDQNIYPPMSDFLIQKGVKLFKGFSPSNLILPNLSSKPVPPDSDSLNKDYSENNNYFDSSNINHSNYPDLVIIGNAVTKNNVEAAAVMEKNIPYCSMPQALNHFIAEDKKILLVTGTHGKTTTSSILAYILNQAGLDPSFMIGGIVKEFESNYRVGKGSYIVIEGDEYDTAFFDKSSKFMHYSPYIAILTSVEFDHADIFKDIDHVKDVFRKFIAKMPKDSLLIASGEDADIKEIISSALCTVQYYGRHSENSLSYSSFSVQDGFADFSVKLKDIAAKSNNNDLQEDEIVKYTIKQNELIKDEFKKENLKENELKVITPIMGMHNAMNITAVIGAAKNIGIDNQTILQALKSFKGVKRRQDIRGVKNGITVMDDFAHHPSAVRETIAGVKPFFKNSRLVAVFEPRTNSSMRDIFQNDYPKSFDGADIVCIRKPSMLSKVPEQNRIDTEKLVKDIVKQGIQAFYFEETDTIIDFLVKESKSGDLILIMSNGGFDNIHKRLLEKL